MCIRDSIRDVKRVDEATRAAAPAPMLADGVSTTNYRTLRTVDGREVRAFGKGQRMADTVPMMSGGLDLEGFGRGLAATISGNRRGAESECRALSEGLNTGGGFFVSEALSAQLIDLSRNRSRCYEAGTVAIDMPTEQLRLVTVESDPTIALVGENSLIASSDPSFGSRLLTAKKHGVIVKVSNELMADGMGAGEAVVSALASALGTYVDDLLLDYLFDEAGVGNTPTVGQPDWDDVISGMAAIQTLNGTPTALLWNPTTVSWYSKLKEATTNAYLKRPEVVNSLNFLDTNQVASTKMILGDFTQLSLIHISEPTRPY